MDDWTELEALAEELRRTNEERWHQTEELRQQLSGLQPHWELISRQYSDLAVDDHLRVMNQRLLGGLGSVEVVHSGAGIEYLASLVWPSQIGPHGGSGVTGDGVCRIEVWLGPSMDDGQARIRIAGAKRLEAKLPTTSERFRAALLSVFQTPQFVDRPSSTEGEGIGSSDAGTTPLPESEPASTDEREALDTDG